MHTPELVTLPLPLTWPEDVFEALLLEAAGMPMLQPGQPTPDLPTAAFAELIAARDRFARSLHAARIRTDRGEYIAVWLEACVEAAVDEAWAASPERGFWLHAVARSLCVMAVRWAMGAVRGEAEPEAAPKAAAGAALEAAPESACRCAPVPGPDAGLAAALNLAGLACGGQDALHLGWRLGRRYAVVTYAAPGGCGSCALAPQCPSRLDA
jgi:hypothetical protein